MENLTINHTLATLCNTPVSSDRRSELIYEGAVLTLEYAGREHNKALLQASRQAGDFGSLFKSENAYAKKAAEWSDDVLFFCAKKANDICGRSTDRANRRTYTGVNLAGDVVFMNMLGGIMSEVLHSVTPTLVSDLVGEMCSVVTTPRGKSYEAEISSNAVTRWYDSSWTSLRSVPQDQLYNRAISINPRPSATRFVLDYYQMTGGSGNLVQTIASVAAGYAANLMQKFTVAFTAAAADPTYVPASLTATGYNNDNWATLCQNVAKANGVRRTDLIAYGDFNAVRKVLPGNTYGASIMTALGDEYFRNGYLMTHDGVKIYEISPTSTPETVNTTYTSVFPTDMIVIAARADKRYAPMIMCFEEDCDAQISLVPDNDVMATGRIEGLSMASFAIAPAFASKVGVITNVV